MRRERGFTLIEIMLVIAIGFGLILSATVLFNVAKNNASTARARDKVLALQSVVEQVASAQGGTYPDMVQLPQIWEQRRPNDYNVSPWGGVILHGCPDGTGTFPAGTAFIPGLAGQAGAPGQTGFVECSYVDLTPGVYATPFPSPASASVGELDYRRISVPAGTAQAAAASFYDDALNVQVTVRSYAISIRGIDGNDFFYVGRKD